MPSETADDNIPGKQNPPPSDPPKASVDQSQEATDNRPQGANGLNTPSTASTPKDAGDRKPARGQEPFEKWEREEMEHLLGELRGHLGMQNVFSMSSCLLTNIAVVYPNRFLEGEDVANNFLFNADRSVGSHISDDHALIFCQVASDAYIRLI